MRKWAAGIVAGLATGAAFVIHAGNPSSGPATHTAIVADANGSTFHSASPAN